MDDEKFDVVIIGTGITESIAAAALSKAGFKVAHIDENPYYGGNQASLSLDELVQWADSVASSNYTSVSRSVEIPPQPRRYSICLSPSVIPSIGPITSSLISSGVARYGGFHLLERVAVYHSSRTIQNVPGTKEDVFKSKEISLVNKRRLMRFLMFAIGEFEDKKELEGAHEMPFADFLKTAFSLGDDIQSASVFALAFCFSPTDPTLPALRRVQRYLRSAGRYGASSFLIGDYGGVGEIAQGFCRAAAVNGGIYILGRKILSVNDSSTALLDHSSSRPNYFISLEDVPDILTSHVIISSMSHLPADIKTFRKPSSDSTSTYSSSSIARCVAIVDQGIAPPPLPAPPSEGSSVEGELTTEGPSETDQAQAPLDASIIVFPPGTVEGGSETIAATVLITGPKTMSTPQGTWTWYLSLPIQSNEDGRSAEQLLQPYLGATLALTGKSNTLLPSPSSPVPSAASHNDPLPKPLFTLFYIEHPNPTAEFTQDAGLEHCIITPSLPPALPLAEVADTAAIHAETVFWEAVKSLRSIGIQPTTDREPENLEGGDYPEMSFWPPLEPEDEPGEAEAW